MNEVDCGMSGFSTGCESLVQWGILGSDSVWELG